MRDLIDRQVALDCLCACYEEVNYGDNDEAIALLGYAMHYVEQMPTVDVETISDGYHTFADLYEQRMILSAALAKNNPHAWKSKLHEDGSLPFGGGWFIMGFDTADGEYTYHYELKDWDLFDCKEIPCGKPWDGHTSKDVRRLLSLPAIEPKRGEWIKVRVGPYQHTYGMRCSHCDATYMLSFECEEYFKAKAESTHYCSNCGADMRGDSNASD